MGRTGLAVIVLALLGATGALAPEADKPGTSSESRLAAQSGSITVLQVPRVVMECTYFKARMGILKAEVDQESTRLKRAADELNRGIELEEPLPPDPVKREARERFRLEAESLRKSFLERERAIFATVHRELRKQVAAYQRETGKPVVFKWGNPDDLSDCGEPVLPEGEKPLSQVEDITDELLRRLNASFAKRRLENRKRDRPLGEEPESDVSVAEHPQQNDRETRSR